MAVTVQKLKSNLQNALKSTGPKTPQGKARVRYNALKHGILAREVVITSGDGKENEEDFNRLLAALHDELSPEGATEEMLVERIAACHWRLARVLRCERGEIRKCLDVVRHRNLIDRIEGFTYDPTYLASHKKYLVRNTFGIGHLIDILERVHAEVESQGALSEDAWEDISLHFQSQSYLAETGDGDIAWVHFLPRLERASENGKGNEEVLRVLEAERRRLLDLRDAVSTRESQEMEAQTASLSLPNAETSQKLLRYEQMLNRELYRTMRQLERLQRLRGGEAVPPPVSVDT